MFKAQTPFRKWSFPWMKYKVTSYYVDGLAIFTAGGLLNACAEKFILGMSDEASITSRSISAGVVMTLGALVTNESQHAMQKQFNINDSSSWLKRRGLDILLLSGIYGLATPMLYGASRMIAGDALEWNQLWQDGLYGFVSYAPIAGAVTYSLDYFRTLFEKSDSPWVPQKIKQLSRKKKRRFAYATTAASIATIASLYVFGPDPKPALKKYQPLSEREVVLEDEVRETHLHKGAVCRSKEWSYTTESEL